MLYYISPRASEASKQVSQLLDAQLRAYKTSVRVWVQRLCRSSSFLMLMSMFQGRFCVTAIAIEVA